jgi:hypothetical protein
MVDWLDTVSLALLVIGLGICIGVIWYERGCKCPWAGRGR